MSVQDIIKRHIIQSGPMDIATYMNICLGHPVHGYYMKQDPFGCAGDFTTAPEISQLYGEMVGVWLADAWQQMGAPSQFILLECGPGRGTFMQDILRATTHVPGFAQAAQVHLVETSPVLRSIQAQIITSSLYPVCWHDTIDELPQDYPIFFVANELFDALPVRQAMRLHGAWVERVVTLNAEGVLCFGSGTVLPAHLFPVCDENSVVEFSSARDHFADALSHRLKMQGGAGLIVDYGFEGPAVGDTLQAIRKHDYCSVLDCCGDADLTSHVDFTAIRCVAERAGVHATPVVTQGQFLKCLGINVRLNQLLVKSDTVQKEQLLSGYHRLVDIDKMGELFKVVALYYPSSFNLAGF